MCGTQSTTPRGFLSPHKQVYLFAWTILLALMYADDHVIGLDDLCKPVRVERFHSEDLVLT